MAWRTNQELIAEGDRERRERTLGERIKDKTDDRTTDEKLFEEILSKTYELGDLVAEHHAEINRFLCEERARSCEIKAALESYRKAIKK